MPLHSAVIIKREAERALANLERPGAVKNALQIILGVIKDDQRADLDMTLRVFRQGGRGDVRDQYVVHERDEQDVLFTIEHYVEYGFDECPLRIILAPRLRNGVEITQEVETEIKEKVSLDMIHEVVLGAAVNQGAVAAQQIADEAVEIFKKVEVDSD